MELLVAIILGSTFGFVLYNIGVTQGENLLNMMRLKETRLIKTLLLAIGFAAVLLFASNLLGLFDQSHFSIKGMNYGVIIGGAIFGIGWGMTGYCPGTSVTALGAGKKGIIYFIIGGIVGAYLFALAYDFLSQLGLFNPLFSGVSTTVEAGTKSNELFNVGPIGGIIFGLVLILGAYLVPNKG